MKKGWVIGLLVLAGIVGAWGGYWIGHAAGWSENADWPATIGGGTGAILLSIGLSVLAVLATGVFLFLRPVVTNRRLLSIGMPAKATVLEVWNTGAGSSLFPEERALYAFELEVRPAGQTSYRTRATKYLTEAEVASMRQGREVEVRYDARHPGRVTIVGPVLERVG